MKKSSWLLILGILAVMVAGILTGYAYWQNSRTASQIVVLDNSLKNYREQVLQGENQQILQAISAKRVVNDLKKDMVVWSEVIRKIRSTIPVEGGLPLVDVLSYSGSANRDISMNVKTVPGSEAPYFDVADLIEQFSDDQAFDDVFVPSISSSTDVEGSEILSFLMTVKYRSSADIQAAIGDILTESLEETPVEPAVVAPVAPVATPVVPVAEPVAEPVETPAEPVSR